VESYVDDIVVKSRKAFDHASDLQETFDNLRAAGMKLNPEKCVFGVRAGKLLGFLVSERGIEANPEKIDAILQMKPPSSVREVQKLAGRIAALSRFLSKAAERGLPFFKTLRGAGKFNWTPECQAAFDELKQYLQSPPTLISPAPGSELLLYLAASPVAVSAALVQETDSGQKPVYFVSEALQGAKTRYIEMEKLAYALVMASRKLKHYFQAHKVIVPSQYPLGEILRGKEVTGRLSKWAAELSPFDLHFVARTAVKSQVLADFVAEWTPALAPEPEPVEQPWVMHSDGSWSHKGAGIAAVLTSPSGVPIQYATRLQFDITNNATEYEAILLGLRKAKAMGIRRLLIRTDSKLVAGHIDKSFEAKEEGMKRYLEAVRSMEKCFTGITVELLPKPNHRFRGCAGDRQEGVRYDDILQSRRRNMRACPGFRRGRAGGITMRAILLRTGLRILLFLLPITFDGGLRATASSDLAAFRDRTFAFFQSASLVIAGPRGVRSAWQFAGIDTVHSAVSMALEQAGELGCG
jgi:hypothetical protein